LCSIRSAASCGQTRHEISCTRGARTGLAPLSAGLTRSLHTAAVTAATSYAPDDELLHRRELGRQPPIGPGPSTRARTAPRAAPGTGPRGSTVLEDREPAPHADLEPRGLRARLASSNVRKLARGDPNAIVHVVFLHRARGHLSRRSPEPPDAGSRRPSRPACTARSSFPSSTPGSGAEERWQAVRPVCIEQPIGAPLGNRTDFERRGDGKEIASESEWRRRGSCRNDSTAPVGENHRVVDRGDEPRRPPTLAGIGCVVCRGPRHGPAVRSAANTRPAPEGRRRHGWRRWRIRGGAPGGSSRSAAGPG